MCLICGWIYDEAAGDPEHGIAPGTAWADVPMNWTCPECGARKEDFEMVADLRPERRTGCRAARLTEESSFGNRSFGRRCHAAPRCW